MTVNPGTKAITESNGATSQVAVISGSVENQGEELKSVAAGHAIAHEDMYELTVIRLADEFPITDLGHPTMATWSLEGRTATGGNRSLLRIVDANSKVVRVTPTEVQLRLPDQERVTVATLSGAPRRDRNLVLERMLDGSCVLKVDEGEPIPCLNWTCH